MAGFNLTAQLNLRGPSNVRQIVSDIRKQLGTITGDINLKINATSTRNITQLNAALSTLNSNLAQTQGNATAAANAISSFVNAANSINRTISPISTSISSVTESTAKLTQSQTKVRKAISESSTELQEFGKQSALATRRFAAFSGATGVILGISNAFKSGISSFIEYEKEFVKVQQVTGKTSGELKGLESEITRLSTGLGIASADLIKVSSTLSQAGLSARDTRIALEALAQSALAPSFDSLNDTVEGSIALMRQFGVGADQLTGALGSINAVAAAFAVEASDLIAAVQRTGGVFAAASKGVSDGTQALNEFLAIFTSVRQTTRESAETIATGLRTIFTRVQRADTIEALREYGISLTDVEGKFVGAYKAVELLSKGLGSLDPRDIRFSSIVEELGGFRQIGKVIPLIQQFGVAQQALGVAQKGQSSLARDAVVAQQSLANQIVKVREEFLSLMRSVGSSDTFQTIAKSALGFTSTLIKLADSVKGVLPILTIIGAGKLARGLGQFGTGFIGGLSSTKNRNDNIPPIGGSSGTDTGGTGGGGGGVSPQNLSENLSLLDDLLRQNTNAIDNLGNYFSSLSTSIGNINQFSQEVQTNTISLNSNTISIDNLTQAILSTNIGNQQQLNFGGIVKRFARGGVVPGVGNRDTVPAMLEPGEFVIRKKAVETIGIDKLHKINKYEFGGKVSDLQELYPSIGQAFGYDDVSDDRIDDSSKFVKIDPKQLSKQDISKWKKSKAKSWKKFENLLESSFGTGQSASGPGSSWALLDFPYTRSEAKFLPFGASYGGANDTDRVKGNNEKTIAAKNYLFEQSTIRNKGNRPNLKVDELEKITTLPPATVYWADPREFSAYGLNSGGLIQKFMAGEAVEKLPASSTNILKALGGVLPASEIAGVGVLEVRDLLVKRKLNAREQEARKKLLKAYGDLGIEQRAAEEAAINQATKFNIIGLFGETKVGTDSRGRNLYDPAWDYSLDRGPKDIEGISTYMTIRGLKKQYSSVVYDMQKKQDILDREFARNIQMTSIFGTQGPLVFDFDETLVATDPTLMLNAEKTAIDYAKFDNLKLVEQALQTARLTDLGQELKNRISQTPELLDSIRVLTARPDSNSPLLQKTLNRLGLNISRDKIKGVSGPQNKINNLNESDILIDDRIETIQSIIKKGKRGIVYQELAEDNTKNPAIKAGTAQVQGAIIEKAMALFGAPLVEDADPKRPIDYPQGIGAQAAQYFGVDPDLPTEVKRTLSGAALDRAEKEIARYYRESATQLASGGIVEKFKDFLFGKRKNNYIQDYQSILSSILPAEFLTGDSFLKRPSGKPEGIEIVDTDKNGAYYRGALAYKVLRHNLEKNKTSIPSDQYTILKKFIDENLLFEIGKDSDSDLINLGGAAGPGVLAHETFHDIQGYLYDYYPQIIDKLNSAVQSQQENIRAWYENPNNKKWSGGKNYKFGQIFPKTVLDSPYSLDIVRSIENIFNKRKITMSDAVIQAIIEAHKDQGRNEAIPVLLRAASERNEQAQQILASIFSSSGLNPNFYQMLPKYAEGGEVVERGTIRYLKSDIEKAMQSMGLAYDDFFKKIGTPNSSFDQFMIGGIGPDALEFPRELRPYAPKSKIQVEMEKAAAAKNARIQAALEKRGQSMREYEGRTTEEKEFRKARGFAVGGKVKLFHGSNTGVNDSVLNSFKEKGALSNIAQGYGQGAGFYLYTEKDKAIQHAKMRAGGGSGFVVTSGDTSGKPMVLSFEETLDPKAYDLDYELQKNLVTQWLHDNFDKIKDKAAPDKEKGLAGIRGIIAKDTSKGIMSAGIKTQSAEGTIKPIYAGGDSSIREGEILGQIMNRLQSGDSELVNSFESELFKRPLGLALKYVGSSPLRPVNIETFATGGGISGQDTVPALLTPGEFVINKKAAQKIGYSKLHKMNQADKLQGYNTGGIVGFHKFADGGRAPGDYEAGVQKIQMELEAFAKAIRDGRIIYERSIGTTAQEAKIRADQAAAQAVQIEALRKLATATGDTEQQIHEAVRNFAAQRQGATTGAPGGPTVPAIDIAAKQAADALSYFSLQAEYYGKSIRQYTNTLNRQIIEKVLSLKDQTPQNINRFKARAVELRSRFSLPEGDAKLIQARDELASILRQTTGELNDNKINKAISDLEKNLRNTSYSFDRAISETTLLTSMFNSASDEVNQYKKVLQEFSDATGVAVSELEKIASLEDVKTADNFRKTSESATLLTDRINSISLSMAAFGSFVGKVLDARNSGSSRAAGAFVSGSTTTAGSLAVFGGQVIQNTAAIGAMPGGGAVAGLAQQALGYMIDPFTLAIGGAVIGLTAVAAGLKDANNALREFNIEKAQENIEQSLGRVAEYFKNFEQNIKNVSLLSLIEQQLTIASSSALSKIKIQTEIPKSFWVNIIDSLANQDVASSERSRILEERGIGAYFRTTTFGQDPGTALGMSVNAALGTLPEMIANAVGLSFAEEATRSANENRSLYTALDAASIALKRSAELQPIADQILRLGEERIKYNNVSIEDLIGDLNISGAPSQTAELLARANPAIEEQIIKIKANNDLSDEEKEKRIQSIISIEAEYKARLRYESAFKQLEIERLAKETKRFTTSVQRMLNIMDQAIGKTTAKLEQMYSALELSNASLSGSAKAGDAVIRSINILQNPRAYSETDQVSARNTAANMFGSASSIISQLLNISNNLEDVVLRTINDTIANRQDASPEAISGAVRASLNQKLSDMGLPPELSDKLSSAVKRAFSELRTGEDKNISFNELVEKIPEFAQSISVAREAQKAAIAALEAWQKQLNDYTKVMNQAMEYQLESNDRIRNMSLIRMKSEEDLNRTLGRSTTLVSQRNNINQQTGLLTNGITSPNDIFDNIGRLENQRRFQQDLVSRAQQGGPESAEAINRMTRNLNNTNIALRENYRALKNMADSSDLASAALSKMAEIQQRSAAGISIIEKLVTSDANEINKFNRSLYMLNRNMAGQLNTGSTSEERGNVLQVFSMIAPLLGEQQNAFKANVLESLLQESGIGIGGLFRDVISSLRNPETDTEMQAAIKIYREGIDQQIEANKKLSELYDLMEENTVSVATKALNEAITPKFDAQTLYLKDAAEGINKLVEIAMGKPAQNKAFGGMVYANDGMFVSFQPKGTDTVPAMLTPGEFVVNRQATQKNLPLLKNINSGKTSYYSRGGVVLDSAWSNVEYGKTPTEQLENIKKIRNTSDEVTKTRFIELKNTNIPSNYPTHDIAYAPPTYYANITSEPPWWTKDYVGPAMLYGGQKYNNKDSGKEYPLENIIAAPGISYDAVHRKQFATTKRQVVESSDPLRLEYFNKQIPDRNSLEKFIDVTNNKTKQLKRSEIEEYQKSYANLNLYLKNSEDINTLVSTSSSQSRYGKQLNEATTALLNQAKFKQITSFGGDTDFTISGLTYRALEDNYAFLYRSQGDSLYKGNNEFQNLIGFSPLGILNRGGRIAAGPNNLGSNFKDLHKQTLSYTNTETDGIIKELNDYAALYSKVYDSYKNIILTKTNPESQFIESPSSSSSKSVVSKLENLYDGKVSEISIGSEALTEFAKIKYPITMYNINNDLKWQEYVNGLVRDKIIDRSNVFSGEDDPNSNNFLLPANLSQKAAIELSEVDELGNVTRTKSFPWTSAEFTDRIGLKETFFDKEKSSKNFKVTPKTYKSGQFHIEYKEVEGPMFNRFSGNFEDVPSTYIALRTNENSPEFNPLAELRDKTLYFENFQSLRELLKNSTPDYDNVSREFIPKENNYAYLLDGVRSGLVDNTAYPDLIDLLKKNQIYQQSLQIQDLIIGFRDNNVQDKYIQSIKILSEKYKQAREKRVSDFENKKIKDQLSKATGDFTLTTKLGESEIQQGLTDQDLESLSDPKRVTLARYLYNNEFVKSLGIKSALPTSLSDVDKISKELDSRLQNISMMPGGISSKKYNEVNAIRAFFTSLYKPQSNIESYFKRLGFPLKSKDYIGRSPQPTDPENPHRTPINYYDKIDDKYNIQSLINLLIQREIDYQMGVGGLKTRKPMSQEQREKSIKDIGGWSLSQIDASTGNISSKDKIDIKGYADLESVALNPYNIPPNQDIRTNILKDLAYYYENEKNSIGENIFNPKRSQYILGSDNGRTRHLGLDMFNDVAQMKEDANAADSIIDWYAFQDTILTKKSAEKYSEQLNVLKEFGSDSYNNFRTDSQKYNEFLTGNLYGQLPSYNYIVAKLNSFNQTKPEENTEIENENNLNKGGIVYASTGKYINFKPKGTDTVPAMLTPGEFVVNRSATQKNLPLLKAINNNTNAAQYANGGVIYRFNGSSGPESSSPSRSSLLNPKPRKMSGAEEYTLFAKQQVAAYETDKERRAQQYQEMLDARRKRKPEDKSWLWTEGRGWLDYFGIPTTGNEAKALGMGLASKIIPGTLAVLGAGIGAVGGSIIGLGPWGGFAGGAALGTGGYLLGEQINKLIYNSFDPSYKASIEKIIEENPEQFEAGKWVGFAAEVFGGAAAAHAYEGMLRKIVAGGIQKFGGQITQGSWKEFIVQNALEEQAVKNGVKDALSSSEAIRSGVAKAEQEFVSHSAGNRGSMALRTGETPSPNVGASTFAYGDFNRVDPSRATGFARGMGGAFYTAEMKALRTHLGYLSEARWGWSQDQAELLTYAFKKEHLKDFIDPYSIIKNDGNGQKLLKLLRMKFSELTPNNTVLKDLLGGAPDDTIVKMIQQRKSEIGEGLPILGKTYEEVLGKIELLFAKKLSSLGKLSSSDPKVAAKQAASVLTEALREIGIKGSAATGEQLLAPFTSGSSRNFAIYDTAILELVGRVKFEELMKTRYGLEQLHDIATIGVLKELGNKVVEKEAHEVIHGDVDHKQYGGLIYASNGRFINFQPRGTDTVPAMLTPGEFVVNKQATSKHFDLLKAINSGANTYGDIVSRFAIGGYVKPKYYANGGYNLLNMATANVVKPSFDFGKFMNLLIGQISSVIGTAIKEGFDQLNISAPQNIANRSNGVLNIESNVLDRINEFTNRLKSVTDTLAGLSAIPSEIKITAKHEINVLINGDSALNNLRPDLQAIAMNEIRDAFKKLVNENSPLPSNKLINPFDIG